MHILKLALFLFMTSFPLVCSTQAKALVLSGKWVADLELSQQYFPQLKDQDLNLLKPVIIYIDLFDNRLTFSSQDGSHEHADYLIKLIKNNGKKLSFWMISEDIDLPPNEQIITKHNKESELYIELLDNNVILLKQPGFTAAFRCAEAVLPQVGNAVDLYSLAPVINGRWLGEAEGVQKKISPRARASLSPLWQALIYGTRVDFNIINGHINVVSRRKGLSNNKNRQRLGFKIIEQKGESYYYCGLLTESFTLDQKRLRINKEYFILRPLANQLIISNPELAIDIVLNRLP